MAKDMGMELASCSATGPVTMHDAVRNNKAARSGRLSDNSSHCACRFATIRSVEGRTSCRSAHRKGFAFNRKAQAEALKLIFDQALWQVLKLRRGAFQ